LAVPPLISSASDEGAEVKREREWTVEELIDELDRRDPEWVKTHPEFRAAIVDRDDFKAKAEYLDGRVNAAIRALGVRPIDEIADGIEDKRWADGLKRTQIPGNRPGGGPSGDAGQTEGARATIASAEPPRATAPAPAARTATEKAGGGNASPADLTTGARKMIDAIAKHYPRALPIEHVAKIAGLSTKSSQWPANRRAFEAAPEIEQFGEQWRLRDAAASQRGIASKPDDPAAIRDFWLASFPPSTAAMLRILIGAKGGWLARDHIADMAGVSRTSSGLGSGLKELRDHGLILSSGNEHRVAGVLL
jgi:hypothetical protein